MSSRTGVLYLPATFSTSSQLGAPQPQLWGVLSGRYPVRFACNWLSTQTLLPQEPGGDRNAMLNGHANGYETPDAGSEGAVVLFYPVHGVLHCTSCRKSDVLSVMSCVEVHQRRLQLQTLFVFSAWAGACLLVLAAICSYQYSIYVPSSATTAHVMVPIGIL